MYLYQDGEESLFCLDPGAERRWPGKFWRKSCCCRVFYPDHCRLVLQMMDAESPLEGLATDQLAAEAITSILEDKTVISRSNMEHKTKFMQMLRLPVKTLHAC